MLRKIDIFQQKNVGKENIRPSLIDLVSKICAKNPKRILQGVNRIRIKIKNKNYQLSPHASRALVRMIRKKA